MDATVLGLPLVWEETDDYTISPLHALVIMKGIDSDGDEVHSVIMTENISALEGVGMARYASLYCEDELLGQIHASTGKSQKKQDSGS